MKSVDEHVIEPELGTGVPRKVRFRGRTQGLRIFFGLLFGGIAALIIAVAVNDVRELHLLVADGTTATATVTRKRAYHGKSTSYNLDFTFADSAGAAHNGSTGVGQKEYFRTRTGDRRLITYAPSQPAINRMGPVNTARVQAQDQTWGIVVGIIVVGFSAIFAYLESLWWRKRHLLSRGEAVAGRIIRIIPPRPGSRTNYSGVAYAYSLPMHGERTASTTITVEAAKRLEGKSSATVLVDPNDSKKSALYADLRTVVEIAG